MPKNKRGGKHHKRGKNKSGADRQTGKIEYADEDQVYAKVLSRLGGDYVLLKCSDKKNRKGYICGKFRKRVWLNSGDYVLCSLRTFGNDDSKCSIDIRYNAYQISTLQSSGLLDFDEVEDQEISKIFICNEEIENKNNTIYDELLDPNGSESTENSNSLKEEDINVDDLLDLL
jgi:translation initiation factor 1A